jgi:hypothetical protein
MALLIVIVLAILASMIPVLFDLGKEQIKVKKVKDTYYTMTGSKFFTDTDLGKLFRKAVFNLNMNYPNARQNLKPVEITKLREEFKKLGFEYAVKHKMVWGRDELTKAIIQIAEADDSIICNTYSMVIAEEEAIRIAKNSITRNGMPWN